MISGHRVMANGDARGADRDEVMHRTRGLLADGAAAKLVVVNISATGLMARCETTPAVGDTIRVALPILGETPAQVRWALGGRVGCEFDRPIGLAEYYGMLSTMLRGI